MVACVPEGHGRHEQLTQWWPTHQHCGFGAPPAWTKWISPPAFTMHINPLSPSHHSVQVFSSSSNAVLRLRERSPGKSAAATSTCRQAPLTLLMGHASLRRPVDVPCGQTVLERGEGLIALLQNDHRSSPTSRHRMAKSQRYRDRRDRANFEKHVQVAELQSSWARKTKQHVFAWCAQPEAGPGGD